MFSSLISDTSQATFSFLRDPHGHTYSAGPKNLDHKVDLNKDADLTEVCKCFMNFLQCNLEEPDTLVKCQKNILEQDSYQSIIKHIIKI